jgi:hypothetical protein
MARLVTLASLRQQSQQRADMENSTFLGTSEWNANINASAAELYDLLTTVYEDYFQDSITFTTVAGQDKYTLPSTFFKLLALDQQNGASMPTTCKPFEFAERNRFAKYNTVGQTFEVFFVPACPLLVLDTDTFDGVNGWDEYIVIDAAIKAKTKEETSIAELSKAKNDMIARIRASAPNRDAGMSGSVVDVSRIDPYAEFKNPSIARYRIMGQNIILKSALAFVGYS